MDIQKLYFNTIKFFSPFEHKDQDILSMLKDNGVIQRVWGINLSNRGKYVEVRCNSDIDCQALIQRGIYDSQHNTTYTVEPAYEANRTQITVFNVPLSASGATIKQYLEESNLKVLAHDRQITKFGEQTFYTGVIKYKCLKTEGFTNLPAFKTFYNNRRLGLRHPEQYEEANKAEAERKGKEKENEERIRIQKETDQENVENNRIKRDEEEIEKTRKQVERELQEAKNIERENISILKQLMSPKMDPETANSLLMKSRKINRMDEVPARKPGWKKEDDESAKDDIDMEIHIDESLENETPNEATRQDKHQSQCPTERIEVGFQGEQQLEPTETHIVEEARAEDDPKENNVKPEEENHGKEKTRSRLEIQQARLDEEIKEGQRELAKGKEKMNGLDEKIAEKEENYRAMLDKQAEDLKVMKDETSGPEEGEIVTPPQPRIRTNSLEANVRETRIESKPRRTSSFTDTQTDFTPPPNVESILFDTPMEDEQLTQAAISNFQKKRNKKEANISTDDDLKEAEKKRITNVRQENDLHRVRMGSFRKGYRNKEYRAVRRKVEAGKIHYEDREDIMTYLLLERGDTTRLGLKSDERVAFIAYTLFLTAGDKHKIIDGQTAPKDAKTMWDTPVLELWKRLSDHTEEHKDSLHTYKTILNTINNKRT